MGKNAKTRKVRKATRGVARQIPSLQDALKTLESSSTSLAEMLQAPSLEPRRDSIACCSQGRLGVLEESEAKDVTYPNGSKATAYVGSHLNGQGPWSSRSPTVVAYFPGIVEILAQRDQAVRSKERERVLAYIRENYTDQTAQLIVSNLEEGFTG